MVVEFPEREIFFIEEPIFVGRDGNAVIGHGVECQLPTRTASLTRQLLYDGGEAESLAARLVEADPALTEEDALRRLETSAAAEGNLLNSIRLRLPERVDGILLCQGYGGVFVHTVELWKELSKTRQVLLISPVEPLYGYPEELERYLLTMTGLREESPDLSYFNWIQIVRSVLLSTQHDLLYVEHRSQSLYIFDLLANAARGSIIHDDGFYDGDYFGPAVLGQRLTQRARQNLLDEIYFSTKFNTANYFGLHGNPHNNRALVTAGWFAMRHASENWHWSLPNHHMMQTYYDGAPTEFQLRLPFVDTSLRREDLEYDPDRVLFTTTMHNIKYKGIFALCRAFRHLPDRIRAYCVLGQPDKLPRQLDGHTDRLIMMPKQPKEKIVELYHKSAVYVRVSRDESSPLSMMEALACGLPVITSPKVQENLPLLEDGVTGFIVPPGAHPSILADRIERICSDPSLRAKMSEECMKRARSQGFRENMGLFDRYMSPAGASNG